MSNQGRITNLRPWVKCKRRKCKSEDGKKRCKMVLKVNKEERDKLVIFLKEHNMTSCIVEKKFLKRKRSKKDERGSTSSSQRHIQDGSGDRDDNGDPDPGHEDMELRKGQYPYCFISPCVATSNITAPWVGNGQPPSNANAQIRKGIYRRFWKCINNMYGWLLPQYLDKKKSWWWRMGCYAPAGNYAGVCCGTC